MTSSPSFLSRSKLATVAAWLAIAAACGGRTTIDSTDTVNSGGTNDQGGSSSTTGSTGTSTGTSTTTGTTTGGTTGTGGSTTSGGFAGASIGLAGSTGSGGSAICQGVGCPAIACGPGFESVVVPGACCPICQPCPDCCPLPPKCPPGSHLATLPGVFCPMCVADPKPCDEGRKQYEVMRTQLLDKYSAPCMSNGDCSIPSEINACVYRCGVAVLASNADNWKSNIISFGDQNCSNCPKPIAPPCVMQVARCRMNRCVLETPGPN